MDTKDIIKMRRIDMGLTMKELADKVGVSEGTVSRWESGNIANMKRDKIVALSKAIEVPIDVIMGWKTDADIFQRSAKVVNKSASRLSDRERKHLAKYRELNDAFKTRVDSLTNALLAAQEAESTALLAAHQRTDIEGSAADKKHDEDLMRNDF